QVWVRVPHDREDERLRLHRLRSALNSSRRRRNLWPLEIRLERRAIPAAKVCGGLIAALKEVEERGIPIRRSPHLLVRQDELAQRRVVVCRRWPDGRVPEARGFGIRVGVEHGLRQRLPTWPE